MLGWTREELELQTHMAVQALAAAEAADGELGRFSQRLRDKARVRQLAGISKATIASAENGNNVFPATLEILAKTLGVKMKKVVWPTVSGNPQFIASRSGTDPSHIDVKNFLNRLEHQSLSDFARLLRYLLSELERREDVPAGDTEDTDKRK